MTKYTSDKLVVCSERGGRARASSVGRGAEVTILARGGY